MSRVVPSSFAIHRFEEIDSTNTWMAAAAAAGAPDRSVAVADLQTAGRGRFDRRWEAPPASALLCSVLVRVHLDPPARHLATVAVGLAALDTCAAAGAAGGLKWPNDLVAGDQKFGGILAETDGRPSADGSVAIVVGLGINLTWPGPPGVGATCVADVSGREPDRDALLDSFLLALDPLIDELGSAGGRARLQRSYVDVLVTLGRTVRVELPGESFEGVASGLTEFGHLLVATSSGTREVSAGDVVHLRRATQGGQEARE